MKILLDENFPLPLYHRLRATGYDVEHIILLGLRGMPDRDIRRRLLSEELMFVTQDDEFSDLAADCRATVIISRVRQSRPIHDRVELWCSAIRAFLERPSRERLFEILDSGEIISWEVRT